MTSRWPKLAMPLSRGMFAIIVSAPLLGATSRADSASVESAPTRQPGKVAIDYSHSRLSIQARDVRLLDVLRSACALLGTKLDVPSEIDQTVSRTLGPGSPVAVLTSLLRNSGLNYAMASAPNDPELPISLTILPTSTDAAAFELASTANSEPEISAAPNTPAEQPATPATAVAALTPDGTKQDQPSSAQIDLLNKLLQTGATVETSANVSSTPKDNGVRRKHRRP